MFAKLHRAPRWLRRVLAALGGLLLLLALCEALGWRFLGGPLERTLQERLQREVQLKEGFRLHLLGPVRLRTERLLIGPPAWAEGGEADRPLLRAEDVHLRAPWSTLFAAWRGDTLRISAFEVDRLDAWLQRDADGRANWRFGSPGPDEEASSAGPELPVFDRLTVREGRLSVRDEPLALALDATVRTREGGEAQAAPGEPAGLRVEAEGRWRGEPVFLRGTSSGALPLLGQGAPPEGVPVRLEAGAGETRFAFDGRVREALRLTGFDGRVAFSGPTLGEAGDLFGVTLPSTAKFDAAGRLRHEGEVWRLALERLTVGRSRLAGDFAFDLAPRTPRLAGELRGERLVLADLAPAFGAGAGAKAPGGRVLPQREFDLPSLQAMDAEVKVNLQEVRLGEFFAAPIRPLQAVIGLRDGVLSLDRIVARTAEGELGGSFAIDARGGTPQWSTRLRWAGIRLERWIAPRNPLDARAREGGPAPPFVSGVLGGRADFQGRGRSTAALLGSLQGEGATWVRNGRISHLLVEAAGLDLAQGLGLVVRGDRPLVLNCAVTRVVAQDGVLRPEVAVIDTRDTLLLVEGRVSLRSEELDLTLRARPKDFSPLALRAPVHVRGRLGKPQVQPDIATLGGKALAAAALAALATPLAAVLPFIDPGGGDEPGCERTAAELGGAGQLEAARDAARDASGTPGGEAGAVRDGAEGRD